MIHVHVEVPMFVLSGADGLVSFRREESGRFRKDVLEVRRADITGRRPGTWRHTVLDSPIPIVYVTYRIGLMCSSSVAFVLFLLLCSK